jgi:transposase-like protein
VQGVSTRKVKAITEELCGHSFAASTISAINKGLDEGLIKFAQRRLGEPYPYLILDARYEKVREDGVIQSQVVLLAIRTNWQRRRQVLGPAHPRPTPTAGASALDGIASSGSHARLRDPCRAVRPKRAG